MRDEIQLPESGIGLGLQWSPPPRPIHGFANAEPEMVGPGAPLQNILRALLKILQEPHYTDCTESPSNIYIPCGSDQPAHRRRHANHEVTIHPKESCRGYILPQAVGSSSTLVQEQRGQEWALHRLGVECGERHPSLQ